MNNITVNSEEYNRLRYEYSLLTKDYQQGNEYSKFIGGMPVTLEIDCLRPILRKKDGKYEYHVTLKADGERYLLLIINKEYYFISRNMNFYYSNNNKIDLPDSLFDGEMIGGKGYYIFDCLFYDRKSVMEKDYYSRSTYINYLLNNNNNNTPNLFKKKVWFNLGEVLTFGNIYQEIIKRTGSNISYDGLILQPFDKEYIPFGSWIKKGNIQYKWKPAEKQTIDFKVKVVSNKQWALLTRNGNPFMVNQRQGNPLPAVCYPTNNDKKLITDNDVGEFVLVSNNVFKLDRPRPGKEANTIPTALSVLNFVSNPFTLDILKGETNLKILTRSQLVLSICEKTGVSFLTGSDKEILIKNFELINNPETEFEVRFYKSGSLFGGGVKAHVFSNLNEYLMSKYPYGVISTTDILKGDYRSEYSNQGVNNIIKKKYDVYSENKEAIQLIMKYSRSFGIEPDYDDMRKLKMNSKFVEKEYSSTYYRFGLSKESKTKTVIPEIEGNKSNFVRIKNRVSYYSLPLFRIDLTVVKEGFGVRSARDSIEKYEIEVEYIGNKNGSSPTFEEFFDSLNILMVEILINANNC
jgi:hypothetical protein